MKLMAYFNANRAESLCPQGVAEANREADGYVIKDGIVVVIKDSTIPDGTII